MKVYEVLYEMTYQDAVNVFANYGVDPAVISNPDALKKNYRALLMQHHQDKTGDPEPAKYLNAAYDILTNKPRVDPRQSQTSGGYGGTPGGTKPPGGGGVDDDTEGGTPIWAWAGYSGGMPPNASIYRKDFTDMNFIKKSMWELSGKSRQEFTLWGFDGNFFRNVISVYGSPQIFHYMANAMLTWQTKGGNSYDCRAVFITQKQNPKTLLLVYSDGKYFDNPIPLEHDSFNLNPGNDQQFTRRLPGILDQIAQQQPQ